MANRRGRSVVAVNLRYHATAMAADPSTDTLLRAARTEPQTGFAALHARTAEHLFVWAALHIAPPLRRWLPIEDLVQEVWARAFGGFATFDRRAGTFRAWLLGIAHNVLREQLRARRRRDHRGLDGLAGEPRDVATSVVGKVGRAEAIAALLAVVDGLDETDRRLVAWRGLEGLPYQRIGQRLGVTAVAVESRWRRLVERLAGRLSPDLLRS